MKITIGKSASVSVVVDGSNTARAVGSGGLDVFATPMMIALMERAACKCLEGCMGEGQTSVGTAVNVSHTAPSPVGAVIIATATIENEYGRSIEFAVAASDGAGEIGGGRHTRVIVDGERLLGKAGMRK